MCVMSEFREQYTRSQMTQRYSSCRSACLSAMCRFRDALEHNTLPHSWHVNTFLGDAPATAKPSSLWSGPHVLPPADPPSLANLQLFFFSDNYSYITRSCPSDSLVSPRHYYLLTSTVVIIIIIVNNNNNNDVYIASSRARIERVTDGTSPGGNTPV